MIFLYIESYNSVGIAIRKFCAIELAHSGWEKPERDDAIGEQTPKIVWHTSKLSCTNIERKRTEYRNSWT